MLKASLRRAGTLLGLLLSLAALPAAAEERRLVDGWLFHAGEAQNGQDPGLGDLTWQRVSVPHDWGVIDRPGGKGPFDPQVRGGEDIGYLPGGIGWYRRHLTLSARDAAQVVRINFEAVYMDADIWLNGEHVGKHHYGYTPFTLDLTGKVRAGDNVIAVRVNHETPSSRWYAGSGLIRPASLELLDPVHVDPQSVYVTTPLATTEQGQVIARATIRNTSRSRKRVAVLTQVVAANGMVVAEERQRHALRAGAVQDVSAALSVARPALWSPDSPNLYRLVQRVEVDGSIVDERRTRFGIRVVTMDSTYGLRINGTPYNLRGGNIHHDNYMLGAAGVPAADKRKIALLKSAGYNAVRIAHNPASQAMLDAADELGMLIMDEAFDMWKQSKRPFDYSRFFAQNWEADLRSMLVAHRNHPSIILWSIGNEIREQGSPAGVEQARKMVALVKQFDASRAVTQGLNLNSPQNAAHFAELDVAGYNYRTRFFAQDHKDHPERVMVSTESFSRRASRIGG